MIDFFILGVPRSATTSLYYTLKNVSGIDMSSIKEPRFFEVSGNDVLRYEGPGDESKRSRYVYDEQEYLKLYSGRGLKGEATPTYFNSDFALKRIKSRCKSPKFVVFLRNPVDRAYSHYLQNLASGNEAENFMAALEWGESRVESGWHVTWDIKSYSMYADRIELWIESFGRENIFFVNYDEYSKRQREVSKNIVEFLTGRDFSLCELDLPAVNSSGKSRYIIVSRLLSFFSRNKYFFRRMMPSSFLHVMQKVFHFIREKNLKSADEISPNDRKLALRFFKRDIEKVEFLLGWDLGSWKDAG